MALTKTPIELSSTPGIVDNSNATAITIDSSENVGIGASSPSANLEITQSGNNVGLLVSGGTWNYTAKFRSSDAEANIIIEDSNSTTDGNMIGVVTNDMYFITNATERMRIDASGNVLVGKTSSSVSSSGLTVVANDFMSYTNTSTDSGDRCLILNRQNGSGNILDFRQANGLVGSIGTNVGRLSIGSGDTGVLFAGDIDAIYPANGIAARDSAIDLGVSSARFKDLYLSGAANVGSEVVLADSGTAKFAIGNSGNDFYIYSNAAGSERMRIDSSGNLLVGATASVAGARLEVTENAGNLVWFGNSSGTGLYMVAGGTAWVTSSDERVKDIIEPISGAIAKLSTLRTVIGKYKTDNQGVRRPFLIAQDLQAVFPEAVNEQEDELKTLGVEYSSLIPLLIAGMKEQQNLIESLTARVAALEE